MPMHALTVCFTAAVNLSGEQKYPVERAVYDRRPYKFHESQGMLVHATQFDLLAPSGPCS